MSISTCPKHGKVVNFGGLFFGVSLHHLLMHLNLFRHHWALHRVECVEGWVSSFVSAVAPL